MVDYELLEAINVNKIMKKEEKIQKALSLIEQITNKKPVLKEQLEAGTIRVFKNAKMKAFDAIVDVSRSAIKQKSQDKLIKRPHNSDSYWVNKVVLADGTVGYVWADKQLEKMNTESATKQIVEEAMRIVSKDVLAPKVVRDGLLKETVEKPIKRRFYAVTDDFEKQAKRLLAFYNDMLVLHPELKSEVGKIKRALGSIEQTFTNTEMFINESKKEEQLELDLKEEESLQEETVESVSQKKYKYIDKNLEGRHLTKLVRALGEQGLSQYVNRINDREAVLTEPVGENLELFNDVVDFAIGAHNLILQEDVAGMTTANMAAFDGGLGIKPIERELKEGKKKAPQWSYYDNLNKDIKSNLEAGFFPSEVYRSALNEYEVESEEIKERVERVYSELVDSGKLRNTIGGSRFYKRSVNKRPLKEAITNIVTAGDTVDTKYGKLVILSNPVFGRSKYKIPVMSLNTFNSLATSTRETTTNVPVQFLTVSEGWMRAVKPGLKVPVEHLKKVWNFYVGRKDEIDTKKSEIQQKKYDEASPLINYSTKDYGYVVTMVDSNTAKVGDKVDVRFSNGIFSGVIKSIAGRGDGAVGILFRGRTKAKMVTPKIILRKTGTNK